MNLYAEVFWGAVFAGIGVWRTKKAEWAKRREGMQSVPSSEEKNHRVDDANRGIPRKNGGNDALVTLTGSRAHRTNDFLKPSWVPLPVRTQGKKTAKPCEMKTKTKFGHVRISLESFGCVNHAIVTSGRKNRSGWCFA